MSIKYELTKFIPDKLYLKMLYRKHFHKSIDFKNPKTYNEKLQWLKLYNKNDLYTKLVDKYLVKNYVEEKIGKQYVIPTLGVWKTPEEIDFNSLPDQFVLKWNHDSGSVVICKDKSKLDVKNALKRLSKGKRYSGFWYGREWPYKNVVPCVIAEKYMEDAETSELRDYKFFCFNGEPKMLFVATDRQKVGEETKFDFFDMEYNHLPFTNGHPHASAIPRKPKCFDEMKVLANKLAADFPHVRVDFYEVDGEVYFGEMTFFHWSGLMPFDPPEWDEKMGEWIKLPTQNR